MIILKFFDFLQFNFQLSSQYLKFDRIFLSNNQLIKYVGIPEGKHHIIVVRIIVVLIKGDK